MDAGQVVTPALPQVAVLAERVDEPIELPPDDRSEPPAAPVSRRGTSKGRSRSRNVETGTPAAPTVVPAVPAVAGAPTVTTPAPTWPSARIVAPSDGALFGRYAVWVDGEEEAEVTLRAAAPGTALCTCLDFALSEDATCPHVQALLTQVQADPNRAAALAAGPSATASRIELQHGARRRLLWLPGSGCPPAGDALARSLLEPDGDSDDGLQDDAALARLLRQARDAGHTLVVDESVWEHRAVQRDARWRVHRLEQALPQGPDSPVLHDLLPHPPLLPLQWEGALFAICAGRCILADDAVLQPPLQALAAATLWTSRFGVDRVLVLAPADALDRWRRWLPAGAAGWSLMALDSVASDAMLHRGLAPELVIVQEPDTGGLWVDAERAAALLRLTSEHAIVLPGAGWLDRPAELPLRLAFVDASRQGAYAALLNSHGERDADGQLCGLHGLDGLRGTLESVLLMRTRAEVLSQLPERLDRVRRVAMPEGERRQQVQDLPRVAAALDRWVRLGWMPDAAQRRIVQDVQGLRRWCAGDGAPGLAAAKAQAVLDVLADPDGPVAQLVVFSQWPRALDAVHDVLRAAGVKAVRWSAEGDAATRAAAARQFAEGGDCRVLLADDAGSASLDLQQTTAQVLHLDLPWNPRQLNRRFGRVYRRGQAHLVPVTQLLAADSLEDRLHALQASRTGQELPSCDLLDAGATEGFLQGAALAQWLDDLQRLLVPADGTDGTFASGAPDRAPAPGSA
jgi:hypothetical protein